MSRPPKPRAFRLDDRRIVVSDAPSKDIAPDAILLAPQPDSLVDETEAEAAVEEAQDIGLRRRSKLTAGRVLVSALSALVALAVGLWFDALVESAFVHAPWLGLVTLALVAIAGLALLVVTAREIRAIGRQRRIADLHAALAAARLADDRVAARRLVGAVAALYTERPATARARTEIETARGEIIDGVDLIDLAERQLMEPLDRAARQAVATAAKRVSVVTALSPRAILDVLFVAAQTLRVIRTIAEIYGGRPHVLGVLRLARAVAAHLTITGGMAVGDSLLQQLVGHGIASRLSAKLGEGVTNGLLTARIGLSAMAVCRPMPFASLKQPGVADVAPFLFKRA